MQDSIVIEPLKSDAIVKLHDAFKVIGWDKPVAQFERYLAECQAQERFVWIAQDGDRIAGYNCLLPCSKHFYFKTHSIPEISDLNVLPHYRGHGIATRLIEAAETEARRRSDFIGLGVGLTHDYGAAQILYIKRGYIPLGDGVYSGDKQLQINDQTIVDHGLVLYMQKKL